MGVGAVGGSSFRSAIPVELAAQIIHMLKCNSMPLSPQSTQFLLCRLSVFSFADVAVLWHLYIFKIHFPAQVSMPQKMRRVPQCFLCARSSPVFIVQKSLHANCQVLQTHWPLCQSWQFPQCLLTSEDVFLLPSCLFSHPGTVQFLCPSKIDYGLLLKWGQNFIWGWWHSPLPNELELHFEPVWLKLLLKAIVSQISPSKRSCDSWEYKEGNSQFNSDPKHEVTRLASGKLQFLGLSPHLQCWVIRLPYRDVAKVPGVMYMKCFQQSKRY